MLCNESLDTDQLFDQRIEEEHDDHRMHRGEIPVSVHGEPREAITENERVGNLQSKDWNGKQRTQSTLFLTRNGTKLVLPSLSVSVVSGRKCLLFSWVGLFIDYWGA